MRRYMWANIGPVWLFPQDPENNTNKLFVHILDINSKDAYKIASIFDM